MYTKVLCAFLWIFSSLFTLRYFITQNETAFAPVIATCILMYEKEGIENIVYTVVLIIIPFIVIIIANVTLWIIAYKTSKKHCKSGASTRVEKAKQISAQRQRKSTTTVGLVSALLLISWVPAVTKRLEWGGYASVSLKRATIYLYFINTFANPIVYTLVNRTFVRSAQHKLFKCSRGISHHVPRMEAFTKYVSPQSSDWSPHIT